MTQYKILDAYRELSEEDTYKKLELGECRPLWRIFNPSVVVLTKTLSLYTFRCLALVYTTYCENNKGKLATNPPVLKPGIHRFCKSDDPYKKTYDETKGEAYWWGNWNIPNSDLVLIRYSFASFRSNGTFVDEKQTWHPEEGQRIMWIQNENTPKNDMTLISHNSFLTSIVLLSKVNETSLNSTEIFKYGGKGWEREHKNAQLTYMNYDNKTGALSFTFIDWFYNEGVKFVEVHSSKGKNISTIQGGETYHFIKYNKPEYRLAGEGITLKDDKNGKNSKDNKNYGITPGLSFTSPHVYIYTEPKEGRIAIGVGHVKIRTNSTTNPYVKDSNIQVFRDSIGLFLSKRYKDRYIPNYEGSKNDPDEPCEGWIYMMFFYVLKGYDVNIPGFYKDMFISDAFLPLNCNTHIVHGQTVKSSDGKNRIISDIPGGYVFSLYFPTGLTRNEETNELIVTCGVGDFYSAELNFNTDTVLSFCKHDVKELDMSKYQYYLFPIRDKTEFPGMLVDQHAVGYLPTNENVDLLDFLETIGFNKTYAYNKEGKRVPEIKRRRRRSETSDTFGASGTLQQRIKEEIYNVTNISSKVKLWLEVEKRKSEIGSGSIGGKNKVNPLTEGETCVKKIGENTMLPKGSDPTDIDTHLQNAFQCVGNIFTNSNWIPRSPINYMTGLSTEEILSLNTLEMVKSIFPSKKSVEERAKKYDIPSNIARYISDELNPSGETVMALEEVIQSDQERSRIAEFKAYKDFPNTMAQRRLVMDIQAISSSLDTVFSTRLSLQDLITQIYEAVDAINGNRNYQTMFGRVDENGKITKQGINLKCSIVDDLTKMNDVMSKRGAATEKMNVYFRDKGISMKDTFKDIAEDVSSMIKPIGGYIPEEEEEPEKPGAAVEGTPPSPADTTENLLTEAKEGVFPKEKFVKVTKAVVPPEETKKLTIEKLKKNEKALKEGGKPEDHSISFDVKEAMIVDVMMSNGDPTNNTSQSKPSTIGPIGKPVSTPESQSLTQTILLKGSGVEIVAPSSKSTNEKDKYVYEHPKLTSKDIPEKKVPPSVDMPSLIPEKPSKSNVSQPTTEQKESGITVSKETEQTKEEKGPIKETQQQEKPIIKIEPKQGGAASPRISYSHEIFESYNKEDDTKRIQFVFTTLKEPLKEVSVEYSIDHKLPKQTMPLTMSHYNPGLVWVKTTPHLDIVPHDIIRYKFIYKPEDEETYMKINQTQEYMHYIQPSKKGMQPLKDKPPDVVPVQEKTKDVTQQQAESTTKELQENVPSEKKEKPIAINIDGIIWTEKDVGNVNQAREKKSVTVVEQPPAVKPKPYIDNLKTQYLVVESAVYGTLEPDLTNTFVNPAALANISLCSNTYLSEIMQPSYITYDPKYKFTFIPWTRLLFKTDDVLTETADTVWELDSPIEGGQNFPLSVSVAVYELKLPIANTDVNISSIPLNKFGNSFRSSGVLTGEQSIEGIVELKKHAQKGIVKSPDGKNAVIVSMGRFQSLIDITYRYRCMRRSKNPDFVINKFKRFNSSIDSIMTNKTGLKLNPGLSNELSLKNAQEFGTGGPPIVATIQDKPHFAVSADSKSGASCKDEEARPVDTNGMCSFENYYMHGEYDSEMNLKTCCIKYDTLSKKNPPTGLESNTLWNDLRMEAYGALVKFSEKIKEMIPKIDRYIDRFRSLELWSIPPESVYRLEALISDFVKLQQIMILLRSALNMCTYKNRQRDQQCAFLYSYLNMLHPLVKQTERVFDNIKAMNFSFDGKDTMMIRAKGGAVSEPSLPVTERIKTLFLPVGGKPMPLDDLFLQMIGEWVSMKRFLTSFPYTAVMFSMAGMSMDDDKFGDYIKSTKELQDRMKELSEASKSENAKEVEEIEEQLRTGLHIEERYTKDLAAFRSLSVDDYVNKSNVPIFDYMSVTEFWKAVRPSIAKRDKTAMASVLLSLVSSAAAVGPSDAKLIIDKILAISAFHFAQLTIYSYVIKQQNVKLDMLKHVNQEVMTIHLFGEQVNELDFTVSNALGWVFPVFFDYMSSIPDTDFTYTSVSLSPLSDVGEISLRVAAAVKTWVSDLKSSITRALGGKSDEGTLSSNERKLNNDGFMVDMLFIAACLVSVGITHLTDKDSIKEKDGHVGRVPEQPLLLSDPDAKDAPVLTTWMKCYSKRELSSHDPIRATTYITSRQNIFLPNATVLVPEDPPSPRNIAMMLDENTFKLNTCLIHIMRSVFRGILVYFSVITAIWRRHDRSFDINDSATEIVSYLDYVAMYKHLESVVTDSKRFIRM